MPRIEKALGDFVADAITKNYLITIAITSYTQAKNQTRNLPFGLGKTTLAEKIAYLLYGGSVNDNYQNKNVWEKVHNIMAYDPYSLGVLLEPGKERKPCVIYDDVQATAPASQSVPLAVRSLANFISTERPECACIIFTCPNLNFIAAPLRKLVNFEIIISERGYYEVHKYSYYKDFKRPLQDRMHFDYIEENPRTEPFTALPDFEQQGYDNWRTERKQQLYPNMMKNLKTYTQLQQWEQTGETKTLTLSGHAIKGPHGKCYIEVPEEFKGKLIEGAVTVNG
jgi:hypothetical protein